MMIRDKYVWTNHARMKMRYYRLTESRIKRVIRHPSRVEEGVLEDAIGAMQQAEGKHYSEIWVMYVIARDTSSSGRLSDVPAGHPHSRARFRSFAVGENPARSTSQGP